MTTFRRAAALGAALALTTTVAACGKDSSASAPATSTVVQTVQATQGGQSAQAGQSQNGGATPKEAVENTFHAIGADDSEKACRQMAGKKDGQAFPIAEDETEMAGCKTNVAAIAQGLPAEQKPLLQAVVVTNAQENGDTATVEGKDISLGGQTMESMVSQPINVVRVNGRWYVDVASLWALAASGATAGAGATAVPTAS